MKPYSMDLRQRIINTVNAGESIGAVALRFKVNRQTVRNYIKRHALGALEPSPRKKRVDLKFTAAALEAMTDWMKEKNDLTLKQLQRRLQEQFHIHVSQSAIWRRLAAMRLTWKKNGPRRRTGAAGRPGATKAMAGGNRRHTGGKAGIH